MPQKKDSPPPTPVSSPRVSPTPPDSPNQDPSASSTAASSDPSSSFDNDLPLDPHQPSMALSPSNIPLRPVTAPIDNTPPAVITVDPAPQMPDGLGTIDEMDIDDTPLSPTHHTNGHAGAGTSDDGSGGGSDPDWSADDWMVDMRRVKVYELVGSTWTDRGTALCTGVYDEDLDTAAIVAKSEMNDVELLRSEIHASDVYQKQQDTLIVWTEPDGTDYALSFQDMEGCSEIWDFVLEVQRHFRGKGQTDPNSSFSSSGGESSRLTVASIIASGRLPEPTLGMIPDLDTAIKAIAKTIHGRERVCEYILNEDYIKSLIDVMDQAEDLESLPDLHALHGIMQTILSLNDTGIYDYVLHEDIFPGVVGILEYDPEFPTFKAAYRDFLKNSAQYQRSFEFRDPAIQRKISQTYRLQFLKDVVLARVIDDSTFNVLNSFILFNQIDIINNVVADSSFLSSLFKSFVTDEDILKASGSTSGGGLGDLSGLFGAPTVNGAGGKGRENAPSPPQSPTSTIPSSSQNAKEEEGSGADLMNDLPLQTKANGVVSPSTKGDVVRFIHQLCMMAKNVQIPTRLTLYRVLVERGLLFALEWALRVPLEESTLPPSSSSIPSPTLPSTNGPSSASAPSSSTSVPTISILPPTAQSQALAAPDPDPSLLDMVAEVFILLAEFNVAGVRAHIVRQNERVKALEKEQEKARAGEPVPASGKPVTPGGSFSTGAGGSGSALTGAGSNKLVGNGEPPHLMKALIARLGGSRDLPFRNQIGDAIRLLLETPPPTMDLHTADAKGASLIKLREDPINEHFFPVFYDTAIIQSFYKPLLDIDDWKNLRERILRLTREQAALFLFLCDLLCSMLIQHSHRSQYFILSCGISSKIATLLRTRDKHMRLAALRYFRTCIRINNHFVIRHLIKQECFSPILALAAEEADRDNLVSASCQEFFEHIRKDNLRLPMTHIMEKYEDRVLELAQKDLVGPRFRAFVHRWEMNTAPQVPTTPTANANAVGDTSLSSSDSRKWGQGTNMEAEEESYFNADDDEDDAAALAAAEESPFGVGIGGMDEMGASQTRWAMQMQSGAAAAAASGSQSPSSGKAPANKRNVRASPTATKNNGGAASPASGSKAGAAAGRTTRSASRAAAAAASSPSSPSPVARPDTPMPSSPVSPAPSSSKPIAVPQMLPMRSLLDYGEDDVDDEDDDYTIIGPMPAVTGVENGKPDTSATEAGSPSTPVVLKSSGTNISTHRAAQRSESSPNLASTDPSASTSKAVNGSSSNSVPFPSTASPVSSPTASTSTSTAAQPTSPTPAPSAPQLKRRREDDEDEDDEIFSTLMTRSATTRSQRKSLGSTIVRSISPALKDKGKSRESSAGAESSSDEGSSTGTGSVGKAAGGAAKRIKLSLKAAFGMKDKDSKDGSGKEGGDGG